MRAELDVILVEAEASNANIKKLARLSSRQAFLLLSRSRLVDRFRLELKPRQRNLRHIKGMNRPGSNPIVCCCLAQSSISRRRSLIQDRSLAIDRHPFFIRKSWLAPPGFSLCWPLN